MSDEAALRPEPHRTPGGVDSEADLEAGGDDGPDILQGIAENEPDLASEIRPGAIPFRAPVAGARLTEQQLESDVD